MNENNNPNTMTNEEKRSSLMEKVELAPVRRREIVKTLLILFLAAMLLLTFFSNTIMNRSLAEISTERTTSGKLTETVRGGGMIVSNQVYSVNPASDAVVNEIKIKSGQSVKKDDVLFTVSSVSSSELTAAEAELETMKLEYQKALLTAPNDLSDKDREIKNAQEDLDQAIAKRDNALTAQKDQAENKKKYDADKKEASRLEALSGKLSAAIDAIDTDDYSQAAAEYIGDLKSLYNSYSAAEGEYNSAYAIYTGAVEKAADEGVINSAKADADSKNDARKTAKDAYDKEKSSVRKELADELKKTNAALQEVSGKVAAYESSSGGDGMSYEECAAAVKEKERVLEELILARQQAQNAQNVTDQIAGLDLEAKKKAIDKQEKLVKELKKSTASSEIKSKYDGVVSAVNVQPNDSVSPDMTLAEIDIAEEGYTVEVNVDGEKAAKVKVGAKADIINNWGSNTEAVLTNIKNDTTAGSRSKVLVFSVKGDVDSGTYLDLSIPCGSGNYDTIIPKSAIYEDKDGSFVLRVNSKNTPFGNRYYAERVSVEILSSDEVSCAVQGAIGMGDSIISAASKPVAPGDQVRMKDKS